MTGDMAAHCLMLHRTVRFAVFSFCGVWMSSSHFVTSALTTPATTVTSTATAATELLQVNTSTDLMTNHNLMSLVEILNLWPGVCNMTLGDSQEFHVNLTCHVTRRDNVQWRLDALRSAIGHIQHRLNASKESVQREMGRIDSMKLSVEIQCEAGGNISLPLPMRCPGLVRLKVNNCRLFDQYADLGTPAKMLPDSLEHLDVRDSTWVLETCTLRDMVDKYKSITDHFLCGQDSSLVTWVYRNISDDFQFQLQSPATVEAKNGTGTDQTNSSVHWEEEENCAVSGVDVLRVLRVLQDREPKCVFEKLLIQDESRMPLTNKKHFEFMVKSRFPMLHSMFYSKIGMTVVPRELREWRQYFPHLRYVDLSHNAIEELSFKDAVILNGTIPLRLNLQYNNISRLSLAMFREWAKVPEFYADIGYNPVACGCDLGQFLEAHQDDSQWAGQVLGKYRRDVSELRCVTPPELSGRTLKSLQRSDLQCPVAVADLRAAMSVLGVVVVLLLVLLLLAVRYRREVRILVFTRVHMRLPCGLPHALGSETPDKQYDAFVAYAHQDSEWVLGQLMPQLETPSRRACGPCKLCVHQRDFIVGKPIIDNIIDCIAASRHTIVVLSHSFAKSAWAMEELQQAYRQSLEERRRHLVLVVLEDVPHKDMAPLLRRCCKTFTYLHASDTLFWDRLVYSLRVETKPRTDGKNKTKGNTDDPEPSTSSQNELPTDNNSEVETEDGQFVNQGFEHDELYSDSAVV